MRSRATPRRRAPGDGALAGEREHASTAARCARALPLALGVVGANSPAMLMMPPALTTKSGAYAIPRAASASPSSMVRAGCSRRGDGTAAQPRDGPGVNTAPARTATGRRTRRTGSRRRRDGDAELVGERGPAFGHRSPAVTCARGDEASAPVSIRRGRCPGRRVPPGGEGSPWTSGEQAGCPR